MRSFGFEDRLQHLRDIIGSELDGSDEALEKVLKEANLDVQSAALSIVEAGGLQQDDDEEEEPPPKKPQYHAFFDSFAGLRRNSTDGKRPRECQRETAPQNGRTSSTPMEESLPSGEALPSPEAAFNPFTS